MPLRVMEVSLASMEVIKAMAEIGNPNSVLDAGGTPLSRSGIGGLGSVPTSKSMRGNLEDKVLCCIGSPFR